MTVQVISNFVSQGQARTEIKITFGRKLAEVMFEAFRLPIYLDTQRDSFWYYRAVNGSALRLERISILMTVTICDKEYRACR